MKRISLVVWGVVFAGVLFGQSSASLQLANRNWEYAKSLYESEQYISCREVLLEILSQNPPEERKRESTFLLTMSDLKSDQKGAERRAQTFLLNYPEYLHRQQVYQALGDYFFSKGDYEKAIGIYWEHIDPDKLSLEERYRYYYNYAYSCLSEELYDKASDFFLNLLDAEKYRDDAYYYLSYIAIRHQKKYEKGRSYLSKLEKESSEKKRRLILEAEALYHLQYYDTLLLLENNLTRIAYSREEKKSIHKWLGDAYFYNEQYQQAVDNYVKGESEEPTYFYKLGHAYFELNQYEKSKVNLEKSLPTGQKYAQSAYYLLGQLYVFSGEKEKALGPYERAYQMLTDESITADALFNFAMLSYELNYNPFNESITVLNKFIEQYPNSSNYQKAYDILAKVYLRTSNFSAGLVSLAKIKEKTQPLKDAEQRLLYLSGVNRIHSDDYTEAITLFDKSLSCGGSMKEYMARAYYWKGVALSHGEMKKEALQAFQKYKESSSYAPEYKYDVAYDIGYIYFHQKAYANASSSFEQYVRATSSEKSPRLTDAYNRLGDCAFISRKYGVAIRYYEKAIQLGSSDYAMFQKALSEGILGNKTLKVTSLKKLLSTFPESVYLGGALFEIARTYEISEDLEESIVWYQKILSNDRTKSLHPKAEVRLAQIYHNQGELDSAIHHYKVFLEKYKTNDNHAVILDNLKSIYVEKNSTQEYLDYVAFLGYKVSEVEQDNLIFAAAENLFINRSEGVEQALLDYLNKYPNGKNIVQVYFYYAQYLQEQNRDSLAFDMYMKVVEAGNNRFMESALKEIAPVLFEKQQYDSALAYYTLLEQNAESNLVVLQGMMGQLKSFFQLEQYDKIQALSEKILSHGHISENQQRHTLSVLAKSKLATKNLPQAEQLLKQLAENIATEEGSEAKYLLAEMYFNNEEYNKANDILQDFIQQGTPHQYWLGEAFILFARILYQQEESFQAITALQNLKVNYKTKDDGILEKIDNYLNLWEVSPALEADTLPVDTLRRDTIQKDTN